MDYREAWDKWAPITHAQQAERVKGRLLSADDLNFLADIPNSRELFGLSHCPNPRNPEPAHGGLWAYFDRHVALLQSFQPEHERIKRLWLEPGQVAVTFHPGFPIAAQLASAKRLLLLEQQRRYGKTITKRHSTRCWPTYLRVMDARAEGVIWKRIGEALIAQDAEEPKVWAKKQHVAALEVAFNGWR